MLHPPVHQRVDDAEPDRGHRGDVERIVVAGEAHELGDALVRELADAIGVQRDGVGDRARRRRGRVEEQPPQVRLRLEQRKHPVERRHAALDADGIAAGDALDLVGQERAAAVEARFVQALLRAEVVVDQGLGDARLLRDGGDGGRGESVRAELFGRDVEDLRLPVEAGDSLGAGVGSDHETESSVLI
jgi:uncharacterized protein YoaH (UPF0181 family)